MDEDCWKVEEDRIVGKLIEKISAPPLPVRVAVMRTAICAYSHGQILHQSTQGHTPMHYGKQPHTDMLIEVSDQPPGMRQSERARRGDPQEYMPNPSIVYRGNMLIQLAIQFLSPAPSSNSPPIGSTDILRTIEGKR